MDNDIVWLTALTLVFSGCGSDSSIGDGSIVDAGVAGYSSSTARTLTGGRAAIGGQTNSAAAGGASSAAGADTQGGNTNATGGLGSGFPLGTTGGATFASSTQTTSASGGATTVGGNNSTGGLGSSGGFAVTGGSSTAGTVVASGGATLPVSTVIAGGTQYSGGVSGTGGSATVAATSVTGGSLSTGGVQGAGGSSVSGGTCATVYYRDADGDSWGSEESSCSGGSGWVSRTGDCNDAHEDVFPGQNTTFTVPYTAVGGNQSFDYDCDGMETVAGGAQTSSGLCETSGLGKACTGDGYLPVEPPRTGTDINQLCGSKRYLVCTRAQQECVGAVATDQEAVGCR